jgi:hypothetical protein
MSVWIRQLKGSTEEYDSFECAKDNNFFCNEINGKLHLKEITCTRYRAS